MKIPPDIALANKREHLMALLSQRMEKSNNAFGEYIRRLIGMLPKKLTDGFPKVSPPHSSVGIARIPPEYWPENL